MKKNNDILKVTIDNTPYEVNKGMNILQAAERHGVYIPTLCAHKDLTPYGGCRMCLVEVEGARGFLTACTTPVEDGMVIRTHTDQIQKERREILELMLSEHTSSCLICDEKDECKKSMTTIRKVGVITGCRYCPNDDQCELQQVVDYLGIKEINYPVHYRNLRVEKEDPFYDRDYNLCILCGRCVRICHEVRQANTLTFKQRGRQTIIGPAFARTHIEAGCEFCGACVAVCPTGALAEKARKWDGVPDREEITTCALCGVGCQLRVLIKGDKVIGTLPADDHVVNDSQLCVKGRFCVNELVNQHLRLKSPSIDKNDTKLNINWDEAIALATEKLSHCAPDDFALLISPNCTNEDLYIAQKFVRSVMKSPHIDTPARTFYGNGFNAYLKLMKRSVPLADVENASVILGLGVDLRYGRSVVSVKLRKAMVKSAKIITINPRPHSLSLTAEKWLQPAPDQFAQAMLALVDALQHKKINGALFGEGISRDDFEAVVSMLKNAARAVIIVGSEIMQYDQAQQILETVEKLAEIVNAGVLPLPAQNNLYGSLMMGTYPELMPGKITSAPGKNHDKLKVLYIIGEDPKKLNVAADFIIYQNIYPASYVKANLMLAAAAFTEVDGTFYNGEGRLQQVRKTVAPPGKAYADWEILCQIARKMGATGFDFGSVAEIQQEIAQIIPAFKTLDREPKPLPEYVLLAPKDAPAKRERHSPPVADAEHVYRGILLTSKVEGFHRIINEGRKDV